MYYFTMNGVTCSCDALGELRAAVTITAASEAAAKKPADVRGFIVSKELKPQDTWFSWMGDNGEKLSVSLQAREEALRKEALEKVVKKKQKKRRCHTEVKELPLIDGPITWDVTRKMAKKLGTTNLTRLRSDLFARQKLG